MNALVYVPALRFKAGEYRALKRLAEDVAKRIAPRFLIPPPRDRDPEKGRCLTQQEILHLTGQRIGEHWPMRGAFLEPRFLFTEFGEAESANWLPLIFKGARRAGAVVTPVATLDDMLGVRGNAFRGALPENADLQIGVRVRADEMGGGLEAKVAAAMSAFGITPEKCALILDFQDSDLSDVGVVAGIMAAVLERAQMIGVWQNIIFQGTNYPDKNPAKRPDKEKKTLSVIPRNEWLAWRMAIREDESAFARVTFGDYCSDSASIKFRAGGGGAPIRHFRYCTNESWLVVRGRGDIGLNDAMREISQSILDDPAFAGREFSFADEVIYRMANGRAGPGNSTIWREINICHHITQVVSDIGLLRGFSLKKRVVMDPPIQPSFFGAEVPQ